MIRGSWQGRARRGIILFLLAVVGSAEAAAADPETADSPTADAVLPGETRTGAAWSTFCLERAVLEASQNQLLRARDFLEQCDLSSDESFPGADRAAFLLAYLYVEGKETGRLIDLARSVSGWPRSTPYTRWIGTQLLLLGTRDQRPPRPSVPVTAPGRDTADLARKLTGDGVEDLPDTGPLLASLFLEEGRPEAAAGFLKEHPSRNAAGLHVEALARERLGEDVTSLWDRISRAEPGSPAEIDIVGLAAFRLARHAADREEDPAPYVERVPETSRYRAPARHVLAMFLAEHDRPEAAREILESLWKTPGHRERQQAGLYLAGEILEADRPAEAYALYGEVMQGWQAHFDTLSALATETGREKLWETWNRSGFWPQHLPLDMATAWAARDSAFDTVRDLRGNETPETWTGSPGGSFPLPPVLPPSSGETASLLEIEKAALGAARDWENARWKVQLLEEDQTRRLRFLARGTERIDTELESLTPGVKRLESLSRDRDALLARLEDLKNRFQDRFRSRAAELLLRDRAQRNWARALRQFQVEGTRSDLPFGETDPDSLLGNEEFLGNSMEELLEDVEESIAARLEDSFDRIWTPRLGRDVAAMSERARDLADGFQDLRARLGTEADLVNQDAELARAREELLRLAAVRDTLNLAYVAERDRLARVQVERAREAALRNREAVDYGLAASLYEWSSNDSLMAAADSAGLSSGDLRAECRRRLSAFLADYPESFARAEARFRLADMHLLAAREDFNRKMKGYLAGKDSSVAGAPTEVPFVDVEPALTLYREILAGDAGYPHRDAVLFNLGMILTDVGDARGVGHLADLVENHPDSPFVQEATLRLADDRFDVKDYAACVPLYERAASGEDPGLSAIALYRMGWAEYSRDRFEPAADAFRRLLDLYHHHTIAQSQAVDQSTPWPIKSDLRDEAQDYLVHSLARGGGAKFYARYFERIGPRSYEPAVLQGLAQLESEFSRYAGAIEADSMYIRKYPSDPMSLTSARRVVESFDRWNHPEEARRARLEYAEHFLPGSAWTRANPSRVAEASEFSRTAYHHLALYHHHRARKQKLAGEWQKALDLYEILLQHWSGHPEAPRYHLYAGEAAAGLDRYSQALDHYQRAVAGMEAAGDTSRVLITDTDWQRVAIADAWYRSTMTGNRPGDPAVAADLLRNAQMFLERHPGDERAPEAAWRKGNVAFSHEWYSQAAVDYGTLARNYPGDANAPRAGALRGDCFYREQKFDLARSAYEDALLLIRDHGVDSLARRIEPIVPLCAYRHAETVAESDKSHPEKAAALFAEVAATWPGYEHAGLSLYRAGLGYAAAGRPEEAAASWSALLAGYPDHEYARDAYLKTAEVWEENDRPAEAAGAYRAFSEAYPEDESAAGALLKAAELWAGAGNGAEAEAVRLDYIQRFPEDHETAMSILEPLAERDLETVSPQNPISALIAKGAPGTEDSPAHLTSYLKLAQAHPDLASPEIRARVEFLLGEEAYAAFAQVPITLPLEKSIGKKKEKLEVLLQHYGACGEYDAPRWARGAAYRIGDALIHFGEALLAGERPVDLTGDDLTAYEQVLEDEAWSFYDQGEAVWAELLKKTRNAESDPGEWIAKTRESLWPRLAEKFLFMPEVEYPLAAAEPPAFDPAEISGMAGTGEPAEEKTAVATQ